MKATITSSLEAGTAHPFRIKETILVLSLITSAMFVMVSYWHHFTQAQLTKESIQAISTMVSKTRMYFGPSQSYAGFSANAVAQLGIADTPFSVMGKGSDAMLIDPWGNDASWGYSGGLTGFTIAVGGASEIMKPETCVAIANAFAASAREIRVGSPHSLETGAAEATDLSSLEPVKIAGGTMNVNALTKSCNEPSQAIVLEFS
jgi:hypothetical protein